MMNWIIDNKEWIFSGIGATIIGVLIAILNNKKQKPIMKQKSGRKSTNIQIGGDYKNEK